MSVRIFLVDDEPAVLKGLRVLLGFAPGLEVCGAATQASEALRQMLTEPPDLAVIDLALGKDSGVDLVRDLRGFIPKLKIVVFSMHGEAGSIRAAMRAGADGYVMKEEGSERLVEAIHSVMRGLRFVTAGIAEEADRTLKARKSHRGTGT